jgi:DNA mismatch repair protein MutL
MAAKFIVGCCRPFVRTDLTAKVSVDESPSATIEQEARDFASDVRPRPAQPNPWSMPSDSPTAPAARSNDDLLRWGQSRGEAIDFSRDAPAAGTRSIPSFQPFPNPSSFALPPQFPRSSFETSPSNQPGSLSDIAADDGSSSVSQPERQLRSDVGHVVSGGHLGFQIHQRYLVTEDDEGMVVIDQHALHERILYERIRDRVLSTSMESQRLLIPEPVTLTAAERAAAFEAQEVLRQIGIEIEPFGGDTVLITAYPAMLANVAPSEMLRKVIEPSLESGKTIEARDLLDDMMHMMSCKAAIKAGDKLSPDEISELLEQRQHYADTHHCPHGRPTALFFSREQLDRMFKRT